jgi:dihydroorotate dehydrogenase electron transfer subunit
VGLLGPLGKGFDISGHENYLLVGGGIGLAPLLFAAHELLKRGARVNMFAGGKDRASIGWIAPLLQQMNTDKNITMYYCTEDGSCGDQGLITGHLQRIIDEVSPDFALVCAPETCIVGCIEIFSHNAVLGEASVERMMKCGIGVCGSCSLDDTGDRVCVEGPVFSFDYLRNVREFGKYRRDESGAVGEIG